MVADITTKSLCSVSPVCCVLGTMVYSVQWCILYIGVLGTVVYSVQWCTWYSGVFCTVVYSVQWCIMYSGVLSTVADESIVN